MSKEYLPGLPSKALIKRVRSHLWTFGIRPRGEAWRLAWEWADQIASSYYHRRWPLPSEIASQYVFLLLHDMKDHGSLRLPFRANEVTPSGIRTLLSETIPFQKTLTVEVKI